MGRRREGRLDRAIRLVEARFGAGFARRLRDHRPQPETPPSSGSLALDLAIGTGGLPRGHVAEYVGPPSSGRTSLLYAAFARSQHRGGLVGLIDLEGTVPAESLLAAGGAYDEVLVAQPAHASDAVLMLTILGSCGGFDVLGFSAIPALRYLAPGKLRTADAELVEAYDAARLLARGLRALTAGLRDSPTAVILLNEPLPEASREVGRLRSAGGLSLAHFAALRATLEPREYLPDDSGGLPGMRVALTVEKRKLGAPGGRATVDLWPGRGIDPEAELLALGQACGAVVRDWRGYTLGGVSLGKNTTVATATLAGDRALADRVRAAIVAAHDAARAA